MSTFDDFKPVPTRAALALQQKSKASEFKAIVFEEPKFTRQAKTKAPESIPNQTNHVIQNEIHDDNTNRHSNKPKADDNEFDIKKARQEVLNLAISNQRTIKNKKKMEIFKLVKLGAKPPKKQAKNYKELLAERKRLKDIREERKKFHQLGKNQTGAASVKCRSKTKLQKQQKKRAPVTRIDANYGVVNPKLKKKK